MPTVSYRDFTGTGAENYERWFVPALATLENPDLMHSSRALILENIDGDDDATVLAAFAFIES